MMFPLDDSIPKSPLSGECVIRFCAIRGKVSEIWNLLQTNFQTTIDSLVTASWNPLFHICLRALPKSFAVLITSGFANLVFLLLWYDWCQSNNPHAVNCKKKPAVQSWKRLAPNLVRSWHYSQVYRPWSHIPCYYICLYENMPSWSV